MIKTWFLGTRKEIKALFLELPWKGSYRLPDAIDAKIEKAGAGLVGCDEKH